MRTWNLLLAVVFAASCSGGNDSADPLQDLSKHASTLRLETIAHGERIAGMTSPDQIPGEESDHHQMAGHLAGDMHHDMEHMEQMGGMGGFCGDAAGPMHDLMDDVEYECELHFAEMHGAADMPAAHLEEMRHQNAMGDRLDEIEAMHDAMAEEGCGGGGGGNMHD